jgi:Ca2+-binding EF-hand superfamily protein
VKPVKIFLFACSVGSALVLTGAVSAQSTDEQKSVLQTNFQAADANRDGALDRDEFKVFINANAESDLGRAKQIRRFKAYGRAFSKLDGDGDKAVTLAEIHSARSGE